MMAGLVHIPRMIDKVIASNQNALGEYIFPCPLDNIMLEFLNIGEKEFASRVDSALESEIEAWISDKCRYLSEFEKNAVNEKILNKKPKTNEKCLKFVKLRDRINPARIDVQTWVDLIDLEEGR